MLSDLDLTSSSRVRRPVVKDDSDDFWSASMVDDSTLLNCWFLFRKFERFLLGEPDEKTLIWITYYVYVAQCLNNDVIGGWAYI